MKLILRIIINAIAIWLTSMILSGFEFSGSPLNLLIVAVIFGLVNAFIRPFVKLLTLPLSCLTPGIVYAGHQHPDVDVDNLDKRFVES